MAHRPHKGSILGRMPERVLIVPSKRQPWYGAWEPGARLSIAQLDELRRRGIDPDTVEVMEVRREATHAEYYIPIHTWPPVFAFECPVIGQYGDRVRVIAPDGGVSLIRRDGWAHKPRTSPYSGSLF